MDDGQPITSNQGELFLDAHYWDTNGLTKPPKPNKKDERSAHRTGSTGNESTDNPRKLRERSSWTSSARLPPISTLPQGHWHPVKLRLTTNLVNRSATAELAVFCAETYRLLHSITVHTLAQTDIRPAHHSLFFRRYVVGFHCGPGQAFGLAPLVQLEPEKPTRSSSAPYQNATVSFEPLYVLFPSAEVHDVWLSLLRSYALPELGSTSSGQFYRLWRGIDLEIMEGRHLLESHLSHSFHHHRGQRVASEDGSKDGSASSTQYELYCEVYFGGLLAGRTTCKRLARPGAGRASSVHWNERFHWGDLPPHGQLIIKAWRIKAEKDRLGGPPTPAPNRLKSSVSSSISGGVALISNAGGVSRKEREPSLIGKVQLSLPNFPRGEWVEGLWALSSAIAVPAWHQLMPEVKLKIKVDEATILPSRSYAALQSIVCNITSPDVLRFQPTAPSTNFQPPSHLPILTQHLHFIRLANSTLVPSLCSAIKSEIASLADDSSSASPNTLFRGNSNLTKTMEFAMLQYGRLWLDKSLAGVVRDLVSGHVCIETDATIIEARSKKGDDADTVGKELEANVESLANWCQRIWTDIWRAREDCPNDLKILFYTIRTEVDDHFTPSSVRSRRRQEYPDGAAADSDSDTAEGYPKDLKWQAISAFVFLRFFVPAILNPHMFGLVDGLPDPGVHKTLKLIAKTLQSLANLNTNGNSQEHMRGVKEFMLKQIHGMIDFLLFVSKPTAESNSPLGLSAAEANLRARLSAVPTLQRESIPVPPQMVDSQRHLSMMAATVVRNSRSNETTTAGSEQEDLRAACFDVVSDTLRATARAKVKTFGTPSVDTPQGNRSRSLSTTRPPHSSSKSIPDHRSRESLKSYDAINVNATATGRASSAGWTSRIDHSTRDTGRHPLRRDPSPIRSSSRVSELSSTMAYRIPAAASSSDSNLSDGLALRAAPPMRMRTSSRPSTAPSNGSSGDSHKRGSLRHAASFSRLLLRDDGPAAVVPALPTPSSADTDITAPPYTVTAASSVHHVQTSTVSSDPMSFNSKNEEKKNKRFLRTIFKAAR